MRKRSAKIEWQIVEDEAEWEALRARSALNHTSSGRPGYYRWAVVGLLLLVLGVGWFWHSSRADPASVPPLQTPTPASATSTQTATTIATAPPRPTATPLLERRSLFDQDIARMLEHPEWGIQVYRQQTTGRLREVLDLGLWGQHQELTTPHFHWRYRQRDAPVVATAAPQLEQIYATLRHNLGLPAADDAPRLTITLSETFALESAPYRLRHLDQLWVSSPALYPPMSWAPTDLLLQSLTLPLVDQTLDAASTYHAIGPARGPFLAGLRLWQLWDLDLPLAAWRYDLVRWIYVELPATTPEQPLPLPAHYDDLCATYSLWMDHPAQLEVPLLCAALDTSPWRLPRQVLNYPPRRLPWLNAPIYLDEYVDAHGRTRQISHPGEAIALATLIDYAVATYGRERLPELIANIGRYESWSTLIPAVYGVSAPAFENGWQRYLAQNAGAPNSVPSLTWRQP